MTDTQAIAYLHALETFGVRPGLERMAALCAALDNPQDTLRFVHVAGTNGKGSTCTMLAGILQAAGYKTGLFISPYVLDFCERIQIDGVPCHDSALGRAVARVRRAIESLSADLLPVTEFEALTAAAFLVYQESACDVVVLEVGLGGRLDSTNIIPRPLVSVLTSIALDHTAILGDTLPQIATEKCGILKGGDAVVYPAQAAAVMETITACADRMGTMVHMPDMGQVHEKQADWFGTDAEILGHTVRVPLLGAHMVKNAAVAVKTAQVLRTRGLTIPDAAIVQGIAHAKLPARMQVTEHDGVTTLLDGGHNPACGAALDAVLARHFAGYHIEAVCGLMRDKDAGGFLAAWTPRVARLTAVTLPPPRGATASEIAAPARAQGFACDAVESPRAAYRAALARLQGRERALLLVCGSFALASNANDN
ncbi:MAG: bifunctional folylpolyglutamate synthase/dihydrofolate synthase [Oscillospiraceae bacterium]|jgi:dihydrofolate synthase/folylpolyglutamate synthase|nr:bifunctional folylpolyglutamate synthase/dihydrofolate synthase [Oscillospiraceae bacterium]